MPSSPRSMRAIGIEPSASGLLRSSILTPSSQTSAALAAPARQPHLRRVPPAGRDRGRARGGPAAHVVARGELARRGQEQAHQGCAGAVPELHQRDRAGAAVEHLEAQAVEELGLADRQFLEGVGGLSGARRVRRPAPVNGWSERTDSPVSAVQREKSPVSKPSLNAGSGGTLASSAARVTTSCGRLAVVPSLDENAAPLLLGEEARTLNSPSPVTIGVTSTSYQLPATTSSSVLTVYGSPAGALSQFTVLAPGVVEHSPEVAAVVRLVGVVEAQLRRDDAPIADARRGELDEEVALRVGVDPQEADDPLLVVGAVASM